MTNDVKTSKKPKNDKHLKTLKTFKMNKKTKMVLNHDTDNIQSGGACQPKDKKCLELKATLITKQKEFIDGVNAMKESEKKNPFKLLMGILSISEWKTNLEALARNFQHILDFFQNSSPENPDDNTLNFINALFAISLMYNPPALKFLQSLKSKENDLKYLRVLPENVPKTIQYSSEIILSSVNKDLYSSSLLEDVDKVIASWQKVDAKLISEEELPESNTSLKGIVDAIMSRVLDVLYPSSALGETKKSPKQQKLIVPLTQEQFQKIASEKFTSWLSALQRISEEVISSMTESIDLVRRLIKTLTIITLESNKSRNEELNDLIQRKLTEKEHYLSLVKPIINDITQQLSSLREPPDMENSEYLAALEYYNSFLHIWLYGDNNVILDFKIKMEAELDQALEKINTSVELQNYKLPVKEGFGIHELQTGLESILEQDYKKEQIFPTNLSLKNPIDILDLENFQLLLTAQFKEITGLFPMVTFLSGLTRKMFKTFLPKKPDLMLNTNTNNTPLYQPNPRILKKMGQSLDSLDMILSETSQNYKRLYDIIFSEFPHHLDPRKQIKGNLLDDLQNLVLLKELDG